MLPEGQKYRKVEFCMKFHSSGYKIKFYVFGLLHTCSSHNNHKGHVKEYFQKKIGMHQNKKLGKHKKQVVMKDKALWFIYQKIKNIFNLQKN